MNIVFDTSIWIEYFKGNEKYFDACQQLIENGEVATTEIIFAELLQGALNKRETNLLKDYYAIIPKVEAQDLLLAAGEYSRNEKLISKGIGLIDSVIIIAAIKSDSKLWTLDKKITAFLSKDYLFQSDKKTD